jgi:GNAT superfamily N-acetyltransferase
MLLGMGVGSRGAPTAADDLAELTDRAPKLIDSLPGRNELNYWIDGGQDAVERGFPEEPFILLDKLYIDPQNRGQGAARQVLVEGLQEMAEQYPGMDVRLLAEPLDRSTNQSDLVRLYESVGFEVDNYQDGMSSIPMSLRLPKKVARTGGNTPTAADDLAALTAKASTEATPNLTRFLANSQVKEPVFHAAKADVKEFSPKYRTELSSMGFHFGTADQANFRTGQYDFDSKSPNIGKYYLNIENPLEVSHMASFAPDHLAEKMMDMDLLTEDAYDVLSAKNNYDAIATGDSLVKILKKNGYDGLKYKNEREGEGFSFVPFSPTQIKSAIGNEGTFDPTNPVITKAKGGAVTKNNVERMRNDNRRYLG